MTKPIITKEQVKHIADLAKIDLSPHEIEKYQKELAKGKSPKQVMDELGLRRYCCRGLFLSHVELIDTVARFKKS